MIKENKILFVIFIIAILVNFSGVFNDIYTGDSSLYAAISKEMAYSNNYIEIFVNGEDWLDKPHFPFWVSALSMEVFGFNNFAYKFPAFLFFLLTILYIFLFARQTYGSKTALIAILIFSTAFHIVISNNDVRAEPFLMALIIGSVYHFYRLNIRFSLPDLFLGAFLAGCAVMTKGIFTLIPVVAAIGGEIIFKKQYQNIWKLRWFWAILLTFIFIAPELYSLYIQFDLHPEKNVFGTTGVSGLKFFFWDSQFGRFMNTGPIKGQGDKLFFLHTSLWAFAPWGLVLFWGIIKRAIRREGFVEYASVSAAGLTFLVFSLSKFQLPHYTNIIFPFFAILAAESIMSIRTSGQEKWYKSFQYLNIAVFILVIILTYYFFSPQKPYIMLLLLVLLIGFVWYIVKNETGSIQRVTWFTAVASIALGLYMNTVLNPSILSYQSGYGAASLLNKNYSDYRVNTICLTNWLFEYYLDRPLERVTLEEALEDGKKTIFLVPDECMNVFYGKGNYEVVGTFSHFHITTLNKEFLYHKTRERSLKKHHLVRLKEEK